MSGRGDPDRDRRQEARLRQRVDGLELDAETLCDLLRCQERGICGVWLLL
jgi:hypothetical protein